MSQIDAGFLKSKMDIKCIISFFLAYKVFKSSNSVRIRSNEPEESKYEILISFE